MSEFNKILCCLCGISIEPNNAAMCTTCLQLEYDITKEIDKVITLIQCSKCNRYHVKQDQWNFYDLESQHLLSFLLKKVPNLSNNNTNKNAIKILNASFIWTEPHSKRLKILLEFQKDIDNNITIKTKVIIEYVIINKQCLDCIREATDHTWGGLIQLRQFCGHKKVFYQLESELLTSKLYNLMINIEIKKDGLDFYFKTKNQADRVVNFINSVLPTKTITSKKLVSANEQSHTAKIEHVIHMEIIPLYKGDLVIIPKEYYGSYELMLVSKMSSSVHLINPVTLETCAITALKFFSKPFVPIMLATKQLIPFVVLDIHPIEPPSGSRVDANCGVLAEAEVISSKEYCIDEYTSYCIASTFMLASDN